MLDPGLPWVPGPLAGVGSPPVNPGVRSHAHAVPRGGAPALVHAAAPPSCSVRDAPPSFSVRAALWCFSIGSLLNNSKTLPMYSGPRFISSSQPLALRCSEVVVEDTTDFIVDVNE